MSPSAYKNVTFSSRGRAGVRLSDVLAASVAGATSIDSPNDIVMADVEGKKTKIAITVSTDRLNTTNSITHTVITLRVTVARLPSLGRARRPAAARPHTERSRPPHRACIRRLLLEDHEHVMLHRVLASPCRLERGDLAEFVNARVVLE
jgi:hypothetical protein